MKAVIAVAGMGSRFFPIGKTINKCMLPILNRPVIAYAVADCVAAGVAEIAVVTGPGETGRQVRHYLTEDDGLKAYFTQRGWQRKYAPIARLHEEARFTFIEQPRDAIVAFARDHDVLVHPITGRYCDCGNPAGWLAANNAAAAVDTLTARSGSR